MNIEHPRWGAIMGVVSTKHIKEGDELFTYYGYRPGKIPSDFPWYWELKSTVEEQEDLQVERS